MFKRKLDHIKSIVLKYMREKCLGFREAKKRAEILAKLPIEISDRLFRRAFSALKHEGEVASHSTLGYWACPKATNDPEEIKAQALCWREMKSKAMSMLTDADREIKRLEDKYRVGIGEQREFLTV